MGCKRFIYWTVTTAFCYERKFKCKGCSEYKYCKRKPKNNNLGMMSTKFAALQTYANIGLKGFQNAIDSIGQKRSTWNDISVEEILAREYARGR